MVTSKIDPARAPDELHLRDERPRSPDGRTGAQRRHGCAPELRRLQQPAPAGTITDAAGQDTTMTYNAAGQPLTVTNAQERNDDLHLRERHRQSADRDRSGVWRHDHLHLRRLRPGRERPKTPTATRVVSDYDHLNRLTQRTYPDDTTRDLSPTAGSTSPSRRTGSVASRGTSTMASAGASRRATRRAARSRRCGATAAAWKRWSTPTATAPSGSGMSRAASRAKSAPTTPPTRSTPTTWPAG